MAYAFERDEAVDDAVRRIAREQVATALACLDAVADDGDVQDAIHEVRKCCKRVRGLVRLVRPALGSHYRPANRTARDASRHLSEVRDAHALVATFDDLVDARCAQVPPDGLATIRATLADDADRATREVQRDPTPLVRARRLLEALGDAIDDWTLDDDHDEGVAGGAARTAARARARFDEVVDAHGRADDELLHQWRKRVKYGWYHASLLTPASPRLVGAHADLLHDVASALGDDHDLAVLSAALRDDPERFGDPGQVEDALVLVAGTRADLQRRAVAAAARVHAEAPDAWGRRLVGVLHAWHDHGEEPAVGSLDDLVEHR